MTDRNEHFSATFSDYVRRHKVSEKEDFSSAFRTKRPSAEGIKGWITADETAGPSPYLER